MDALHYILIGIIYAISSGVNAMFLSLMSQDLKETYTRVLTYTLFVPALNTLVALFFSGAICYQLIIHGPQKENPEKVGKA